MPDLCKQVWVSHEEETKSSERGKAERPIKGRVKHKTSGSPGSPSEAGDHGGAAAAAGV